MLKKVLTEIYVRDLNILKTEIEAYSDEAGLWQVKNHINNSAGNLCLHINGNLKYFIGAVLGNTGYIRERESEFKNKNVPREELLKSTDETINIVENTISSLSEKAFAEIFPAKFSDQTVTTGYLLIHLAAHLNYHLGQINYHRRLID
jgi:uncharacterized damage-inducible protein DinB